MNINRTWLSWMVLASIAVATAIVMTIWAVLPILRAGAVLFVWAWLERLT